VNSAEDIVLSGQTAATMIDIWEVERSGQSEAQPDQMPEESDMILLI